MRRLLQTSLVPAVLFTWTIFACSSETKNPESEGNEGPGSGGTKAGSGGSKASGGTQAGGNVGGSQQPGSGGSTSSGGSSGSSGSVGKGGNAPTVETIGAAEFGAGELDAPSNGATITFQSIGAKGWYPSRRDPSSGGCDAYQSGQCCMTKHELTSDALSPWNEELIITLRGPMRVKQFVTYQPDAATNAWNAVAVWDERRKSAPQGVAFDGSGSETSGFSGGIGSECLVDLSTSNKYPCGTAQNPFCPASNESKYYGWEGSKLFVILAAMPHVGSSLLSGAAACSTGTSGNWYDAPWIGFSHGELVRSGKFGDCHCYAKNPAEWWLADGCGQFNAFEVVNDNNEYKNLDIFSTNLFAYHGYVGEGPCGSNCNLSGLSPEVDLVDKATSKEAGSGATASPTKGPGAAFRRPANGYRYFIVLFDVQSRTIQLATIHPERIPNQAQALLPNLPKTVEKSAIDALIALRLPQ